MDEAFQADYGGKLVVDKTKSRGITGKIKTSILYFYLFLAMFLPFYSYTTNINNVTFILPNVAICLLIVFDVISNHGKLRTGGKAKPYVGALVALLLVSFYCNIRYNGSYWVTLNRCITFIFIIILLQTERKNYGRIIVATINIMCLAVIFSLVLRFVYNIDCLYLQNNHISLRTVGGSFYDNRLTYVFIHKSGYGLVLLMLFLLILLNPGIKYQKIKLGIVAITIVVTNSATSIAALFICVIEYFATRKEPSRNRMIVKLILEISCIIIAYLAYNYLIDVRDVSSGGGRFYIWSAGIDTLKQYPQGIGDEFYTRQFVANGRLYNNFHNVFINEMVHYSIIEGVLFTVVSCLPFIRSIRKYKNKSNLIWGFISILLILSMDNALHDSFYTLFMFLACLIFGFTQELKIQEAA